jgi:hypothetical protein
MVLDSARPGLLIAAVTAGAAFVATRLDAQSAQPQIPIRAGVTIVSAVVGDAERQDYEQVVAVAAVTGGELTLRAFAEFEEKGGRRRQVSVNRRVSRADIAGAPVHVLGFHTADAVSTTWIFPRGGRRRCARRWWVRTGRRRGASRQRGSASRARGSLTRHPKGGRATGGWSSSAPADSNPTRG